MADFCKQCSIDVFGEDHRDMAGLTTPKDTAEGLFMAVLCEDCGMCLVNHEGECVSKDCDKKHGLEVK